MIDVVKPYADEYKKEIPIIVAGGIYTGEDMGEFLDLGAAGVQMGTRFVTTNECDASIQFKKDYLNCTEQDIIIIDSPVGLPGRAISNNFLKSVSTNSNSPTNCPYHCIQTCNMEESPYCIALALLNAKKGKMKRGFAFAGQNAYRTDKIVSVRELIRSICEEYNHYIQSKQEQYI